MVGEVVTPHWTATAYLKLARPQLIRYSTCHGVPASLGVWGLQFTSTSRLLFYTRQEKKWKKPGRPWLFTLQAGTWTMCPGLTNNLHLVNNACKIAFIDKELARLNISIVCLQETHLVSSSTIRESNDTGFQQSLSQDDPRLHHEEIFHSNC